jgi:trehalose/maltose hydrolase-like predicted phosphorylase
VKLPHLIGLVAVAAVGAAAALPAQVSSDDSSFVLSSDDPARSPSPFIGNGRIGLVIPALGLGPAESYLAGLYEEAPGDVPRIVRIPVWTPLGICRRAGCLDSTAVTSGQLQEYHQSLDMRSGTARTEYEWASGDERTRVRVESFVSRADGRTGATRLELTPGQAGRYRVRFALAGRAPPRRLALGRIERADPAWRPADIWYPGQMTVRSRRVTLEPTGARLELAATPAGRDTRLSQTARVAWPASLAGFAVRRVASGDSALVEVSFEAQPRQRYVFTQIVAMTTPAEASAAEPDASWDQLAAANAEAWARRWTTDIRVEGNPELQRVVRSMLFYLLASAGEGTALGIPPMGLSSGGYYGHIFWDSDTWMFPPLLLTHPDIARSLVEFRSRTLEAAQANARANGRRGAMYPWEADERGRETTPRFAIQNARSEIHVTGDVAQAQWQYWLATGDSLWLARRAFPVLKETADFWVSRADRDSLGRYHIADVVSVAEGLIGVSDDAYTNAVARKNLELATAASRRLGRAADPRWATVAAGLHLPYDSTSDFYRTYEGAPDSTLGDVTPLLVYPLGVAMSASAKRAQVEQAIRSLLAEGPGAMMGSTLLSVDAAELGDRAMVDSLLPLSYRGHAKGPFLMLSETPTNNAVNFVTGAGGFLQQVIFGYTGLRFGEQGIEPAFDPVLPSSVSRLILRGVWLKGRRYDVVVDGSGRRLVPWNEGPGQ